MSPDERKSLAESQNAEVFVSIHMAAETTGKATGIETIYHKDSKMARLTLQVLCKLL